MTAEDRGFLAVARLVLQDLDLDAVLPRVVEAARTTTGARYAALGVLDQSAAALDRFVTTGIDEATARAIGPLPAGRGLLGELIRNPRPLRVDDVASHPFSYGYPIAHPPMTTFLGVPLFVGGEPYGNLYLTDKAGGAPFTQEDEDAVVALAELAGVAIDHAQRYTRAETRRTDLERTVAALQATMEISRALGGQTELGPMLALIAKRGRALVSARALVIEHVRRDRLVVAAGAGELPADLVGRSLDLRDSVAGTALATRRVQRLEAGPNRRRFERHGLGRFGFHAQAGLIVPLVFRGAALGVLIAADRLTDGPSFTEEDELLLEAFAASAATAIGTAEAATLERRNQRLAAAEQERAQWARELHDETLQGLAALRLALTAGLKADDLEEAARGMRAAIERVDEEIAGLRALITELRPIALDELGLSAAIADLAERSARAGLDVDVDVTAGVAGDGGPGDQRTAIEIAVYRIVQEALTNAYKHGGARRVVVLVVEEGDAIHATIRDDGDGFDPAAATDGFGLLGMHERAVLLGGTVDVASAPGHGTTVTATIPTGSASPVDALIGA